MVKTTRLVEDREDGKSGNLSANGGVSRNRFWLETTLEFPACKSNASLSRTCQTRIPTLLPICQTNCHIGEISAPWTVNPASIQREIVVAPITIHSLKFLLAILIATSGKLTRITGRF